MLQNLTNFFNLIRGRKIKTQLQNSDLIAIGTKDSTWGGGYQPSAIQYQDLANQLGGNLTITTTGTSGPATLIGDVLNIPDYSDAQPKVYRAKLTANETDWLGYGFLYNWYTVNDSRGLANPDGGTGLVAPNEWRVPSDTDWDTLITYVGGSSVAGAKLKSKLNGNIPNNYYGWQNVGGGTDDYNFSAYPGGLRNEFGIYDRIGTNSYMWSLATSFNPLLAKSYFLDGISNGMGNGFINKGTGASVRLVREATAGELLLNDGDTSDTSSLYPYMGNDNTVYTTVKIGTQIWLAQNLRERNYNNLDSVYNASSVSGGDFTNSAWVAKASAQEGAYTIYIDYNYGGILVPYFPQTFETIYTQVLENTLGETVDWLSEPDGPQSRYAAKLSTGRSWYQTHIKLTPGYDVSDYNNFIPTLTQKNLIISRAVAGDLNINFYPVTIDPNGTLTIEPLNNYNDLLGAPDSSVYVEILEYQPEPYYNSLAQGIGIVNL